MRHSRRADNVINRTNYRNSHCLNYCSRRFLVFHRDSISYRYWHWDRISWWTGDKLWFQINFMVFHFLQLMSISKSLMYPFQLWDDLRDHLFFNANPIRSYVKYVTFQSYFKTNRRKRHKFNLKTPVISNRIDFTRGVHSMSATLNQVTWLNCSE